MGLLLLRVAAGTAMVHKGVVSLAEGGQSSLGSLGLGLPAILSGCALVVGFLTPGAGVLAGVVSLAALLARPAHGAPGLFGEGEAATLLIVMVVAAALVGPGAFSLDARLFGRREIIVPRTAVRRGDD
jgi:uncharacterized membrane protein YphA (DoxX/SURF4 family)